MRRRCASSKRVDGLRATSWYQEKGGPFITAMARGADAAATDSPAHTNAQRFRAMLARLGAWLGGPHDACQRLLNLMTRDGRLMGLAPATVHVSLPIGATLVKQGEARREQRPDARR